MERLQKGEIEVEETETGGCSWTWVINLVV
jgi:hypothetical protein